ncbi:MAG: hypothetical protein AB1665_00150 [Candidatus Thermoplasmatota archaeon]
MSDIRDRVAEDRGLLKRIQLHIPGFAGYRRREDMRQADSILRIQVAERLRGARERMEKVRGTLSDNYLVKALEPLGGAIFEAQEMEGMIRHGEQGYSGISWAIRVEEPELNKLYEFDLSLLEGVAALDSKVDQLTASPDLAMDIVKEISASLAELRSTFKRRWALITEVEQWLHMNGPRG